jgi:hypothetical protein
VLTFVTFFTLTFLYLRNIGHWTTYKLSVTDVMNKDCIFNGCCNYIALSRLSEWTLTTIQRYVHSSALIDPNFPLQSRALCYFRSLRITRLPTSLAKLVVSVNGRDYLVLPRLLTLRANSIVEPHPRSNLKIKLLALPWMSYLFLASGFGGFDLYSKKQIRVFYEGLFLSLPCSPSRSLASYQK